MSKIICIANQKGGTGKTTTTECLGVGLANLGKKVLLIDLDPQADLTTCLGWKDTDGLKSTISDVIASSMLDKPFNIEGTVLHSNEGVDVIPANIELSDIEVSLVNTMNREKILENSISDIAKKYDYVLIDCMPSLGMLTVNALSVADEVIIPVQAQYLSAKGMTNLLRTINKVNKKINPSLAIGGIVITLADMRTNMARETVETIRNNYGSNLRIFHSIIPIAVKASESTSKGMSIFEYAKSSPVATAYTALAKEVDKNGKNRNRASEIR